MAPSSRKAPEARPALQLVRADAPSDDELLEGVASGDESWADAFVRRVWPTVALAVRRLLGDGDPDVDDVAQVAVMEVLASVRRFRGQSTLDGWVRTVAAHTVYKSLRRKGLERKLFTALEAAEPERSRLPSPQKAAQVKDAVARVLSHLGELDADRMTAWALHDVHGYGVKEIAEITGVSEAAAQTRLSRGRRELLARLGDDAALAELLTAVEGDLP